MSLRGTIPSELRGTMTTVRLRAFVPVVMTLALAACTSTQTVSTTTTTTEPLSAFVDVSAAPVGWMPVVYGDAQVSVPGTWTVIYDAPPCPSGQTPGEVFVNPRPGLFHCPPVSSPYGSQTVVELLALPSGANIPATLGTRRVINGIPFYQDQGTDYLLQLGVKLTVEGPLAERVLQTVTYSPHFVALASEPAPVVPASWHSVIFGGLRFSVPAGWRTYRTPMWSGLELCGIRQVVPVDDSITLSTDVWHGMGVCPTDEGAPRGACWRPRCLHMSRQRSVSTARQASMTMAVLSPRP